MKWNISVIKGKKSIEILKVVVSEIRKDQNAINYGKKQGKKPVT